MMHVVHWIRKTLSKDKPRGRRPLILPMQSQVKAWRKANRKMGWGIKEEEFAALRDPPEITPLEREQGFIGRLLFYGFGDDGAGHSDSVLSGKKAWEYATRPWWNETWKCEYVDFDRPDDIRLRPGAPPRPKGFYFAKLQPGEKDPSLTVSKFRKRLSKDTGWGPEGLQFLIITHPHVQNLMNKREMPFMTLADYDVAPYGFNDFFDSAQMFCSNHVLGLGIGNVDQNYPLFSIPTLRLI